MDRNFSRAKIIVARNNLSILSSNKIPINIHDSITDREKQTNESGERSENRAAAW